MRTPTAHAIATTALLLAVLSCDNDDPVEPPPPPVTEVHVIRDVDYIADKYFLLDDPQSFLGALPSTINVYMTVTPQELALDPSIIRLPGWAIPDSTAEGAAIARAYADLNAGSRPAVALLKDFRRLERGTDYTVLATADTTAVGIALAQPLAALEQRVVAVRYRNQLGETVGTAFQDTLVLEMIRPPDPKPTGAFASTWPLMMRNAYDLGFGDIDPSTLTIKIKDMLTPRPTMSRPDGSDIPYVQIFGIDRDGTPDGRVDNVFLGWDDELSRSILWFPVLNAFAPPSERVQVWTGGEFAFSGVYLPQYGKSSRIYAERLIPADELDVHQYVIEATVTTQAP